jgi:hypothetical protein
LDDDDEEDEDDGHDVDMTNDGKVVLVNAKQDQV